MPGPQLLKEIILSIDLSWALQQLAAQLAAQAADACLEPEERAAAAEAAEVACNSWVELWHSPRGRFDLVLCTRLPDGSGSVRRVGLALQTHVSKVNQPAAGYTRVVTMKRWSEPPGGQTPGKRMRKATETDR